MLPIPIKGEYFHYRIRLTNKTGEDIRFYFIDGNGMVYKDEDLDMFKDSWNDAFAWGLDVALGIVKNDINSYNLNKEV